MLLISRVVTARSVGPRKSHVDFGVVEGSPLQAEPDIGLLLPCNVIVREEAAGRVVVGFLDPQTMVGLVGKPSVKPVADAAEERLRRVCAALGGNGPTSV